LDASKFVLIDILKLNTSKINYLKLQSDSSSDRVFPMVVNNNMKLKTLTISANIQYCFLYACLHDKKELGVETLDILLTSPIAECLLSLDIEEVKISTDANGRLERLNTLVENNLEIDQQRYGRKPKQRYLHHFYSRF